MYDSINYFIVSALQFLNYFWNSIIMVINICTIVSLNKMESVLPVLAFFLRRHTLPWFVMIPLTVIAATFLL